MMKFSQRSESKMSGFKGLGTLVVVVDEGVFERRARRGQEQDKQTLGDGRETGRETGVLFLLDSNLI